MLDKAGQVDLKGRMLEEESRRVLHILNNGNEPMALFVGGCVRNAVLGRPVDDIDIATRHVPDAVTSLLEAKGAKVIPTGIDHGTVTAVLNEKTFEITTLRRDVETDGRRAVVSYTQDWKEDAQRRDFTMNTLLCDTEGTLYDPTGEGMADLSSRRVVFVGDAVTRIREDYLRILRFFRFHAFYGGGSPDKIGLEACATEAAGLEKLSKERITHEFLKIMSVDSPVIILSIMFANNIMPDIADPEYLPSALNRLCEFQKKYNQTSIMARLLSLSGYHAEHIAVLGNRMVFSGKQKKEFMTLAESYGALAELNEKTVKKAVYYFGNRNALQALFLRLSSSKTQDEALIETAREWVAPTFPLDGNDLKSLGYDDGPEIGRILSAVVTWWIGQDFQPEREECLNRLRHLS